MDVLKILQESGENLYPEDLDFFETELATGGSYDLAYQEKCRALIKKLRAWLTGEDKNGKTDGQKKKAPKGLVVNLSDVAPTEANPAYSAMTPEQIFFRELNELRNTDGYKSGFKQYVKNKPEIDEAFVEAHYSFFTEWEINAILSVKPFSEVFLEKYFGALDQNKIARYQKFSESFFMKHFSQMDAETVLLHGKNEWRKKENRSKQLDVFLRLKGVKI